MHCPSLSTACSVVFLSLKALRLCVIRTQAHICQPVSHRATTVSVSPMQMSLLTDWFCGLAGSQMGVCLLQVYFIVLPFVRVWPFWVKLISLCCLSASCVFSSCFCVDTLSTGGQCSVACGLVLLPAGNCSSARFSPSRLVWSEPCGPKRQQ